MWKRVSSGRREKNNKNAIILERCGGDNELLFPREWDNVSQHMFCWFAAFNASFESFRKADPTKCCSCLIVRRAPYVFHGNSAADNYK